MKFPVMVQAWVCLFYSKYIEKLVLIQKYNRPITYLPVGIKFRCTYIDESDGSSNSHN